MKDKVVIITGASSGIGKALAFEFSGKGAKCVLGARSHEKLAEIAEEIKLKGGEVAFAQTDVSVESDCKNLVLTAVEQFGKIDVLINNAGVFEMNRIILPNGLEKTFMINYLAPFALTLFLLETLKASDEARIVNVSSMAQAGTIDFDNLNGEKYYDGYNAYAVSKLENVLFTYKLARLLKDSHVTSNCLHPGVISTKLLHAGWGIGGASTEEGAQTSVYAATSPEMKGKSGLYLVNSRESKSAALSYDRKVQDKLWEVSLQLTNLDDPFL